MMMAMDGINRIFSKPRSLLHRAGSHGLSLVNRSALARRQFMRHAMGLGGDLPVLATVSEEMPASD